MTTASATSATRGELTQFIAAVSSFHPVLKYTWEISETSLAFLDNKISKEGNGLCTSVYSTTNLQIHIVTCCIHLHIHHTSRTPYLFHSFSDFVVYVMTTLIFPKNQRQCASFSINVAILFLSFKRATTVPNKLIESSTKNSWEGKHWPHSIHSHISPSQPRSQIYHSQKLKLLQNDSETGTIFSQPPLISFKRDKNRGNFWSEVHFKPITNSELTNALAHDAKLVLSFIT